MGHMLPAHGSGTHEPHHGASSAAAARERALTALTLVAVCAIPMAEASVILDGAVHLAQSALAGLRGAVPTDLTVGAAARVAVEVVLSMALLVVGYKLFFRHLDRSRKLEDCGYIVPRGYTSKEVSEMVRRRRRRGDLPPPYPNGWFYMCASDELKVGQMLSVDALGQHFAVFRGTSGAAAVLDAYCPHLGANIVAGGQVLGDCIQCPFHGWTFDGKTGKCVEIPYAEGEVPDFARIKRWPSCEVNGGVYVWFDAEGREPQWQIPVVEEIERGSWTCRGRTEHFINAHIQEVPENGADVAHLSAVHSPFLATGTDLRSIRTAHGPRWRFLEHTWSATWWSMDSDAKHLAGAVVKHRLCIFGVPFPPLDFVANVTQIGPGIVYLRWESVFGRGAFLQSLLPVGPLEQRMRHTVWAEWRVPTLLAKFFLLAEAVQVERDIMIWNNKRFVASPKLIKEDAMIAKFRRWYSQFYSENSRAIAQSADNLDW